MRRARAFWGIAALGTVAAGARVAPAQVFDHPLQLADRGPVFFALPSVGAAPVDARNATVFRQQIALDVTNVPVADALAAISRAAGVQIFYADATIPANSRVTLRATAITLAGALSDVLLDAGVDVELTAGGTLTLVNRTSRLAGALPKPRQPSTTRIAGRATDAATGAPLDQVAVRVEGPGLGAITTADGQYTIRNVPPGTYRLTARRVGYTPLTKTVTTASDSVATIDFALAAAPTKLNEVVTTAVGDQRRYEVGNVISTISADSIAPTAPITSLTDLVSARAPGVAVIETSGITGAGESIRIRGLTSLVLQNDPILIVDGVRQDQSAGGDLSADFAGSSFYGGDHPTPTRLNDLDFNDIETIDVLKGPAASTEYGTDAANGVIVVTTKHGTAGRPRWNVSAERTASEMPQAYPDGYFAWGHSTDGHSGLVQCPVAPGFYGAFGGPGLNGVFGETNGSCVVDSVTRWTPLNHSYYSIFGTGQREKYDLQLSGGSDALRYFVSGGLSNEAGLVKLPDALKQQAAAGAIGLPGAALNPNSEDQRSVRVNSSIRLSPTADLTATGAYLSTYHTTPATDELLQGAVQGNAIRDSAQFYGYGAYGGLYNPLAATKSLGTDNTQRLTGGLTGNWRPATWFTAHATVGLDHESLQTKVLNTPGPDLSPYGALYRAGLALGNAQIDVYSVDLRGSATGTLTHAVRSVTSGGLQLVDNRGTGQISKALGITATNETLNGATNPTVSQQLNRQATLGGYAEEQVGVSERLFLTGALRIDAGSGFGSAYNTAAYPKASVSWLALSGGRTTVRVRGAFGESGVQPLSGAALLLYTPVSIWIDGAAVAGSQINWPGNPTLRPERTTEFEGGTDLGFAGERVSLELTGYSKTTNDALVNQALAWDLGNYTYQLNIGKVRNTGAEASLSATVIEARPVTWTLTVNASVNHNKLIQLAPGVPAQLVNGLYAQFRQSPGYALYGLWAQRIHYADANHDGIIEPAEVTIADSASFVGPSLPTREASVSSRLGLLRGAVTLNGLVDYRGGYRISNQTGWLQALVPQNQQEQSDPQAAAWRQARSVATDKLGCCFVPASFTEDGVGSPGTELEFAL